MRQLKWFVVALVMMLGFSSLAMAQGQGRGNFDPAQFRQRMMDRLKEQLGATDEEWKAIQPKVEKVMEVRQASFGGFGRGRGGFGGGQDNQPQTPVAKATADLRQALEDKDTPAEELQKKMAALREARENARKELAAAQKELKDLLTARQEAVMVVNGYLE